MGQLAFTTGISNKMQTDKYSDIPFYYQGHYRSIINEKNAVDGFSLGLEFKRNNFILVGDIALDFHNLEQYHKLLRNH